LPAQTGPGFPDKPFRGIIAVGKDQDLFLPGRGKTRGVIFRKGQGRGKIWGGLQGVHQKHTANDRFHIPPALYPAGDLHTGFVGKGDQVEGIPQAQVVLEERARKILVHLLVVITHPRGGIQDQHQINRVPLLRRNCGTEQEADE
jgi:hypothetical protein